MSDKRNKVATRVIRTMCWNVRISAAGTACSPDGIQMKQG